MSHARLDHARGWGRGYRGVRKTRSLRRNTTVREHARHLPSLLAHSKNSICEAHDKRTPVLDFGPSVSQLEFCAKMDGNQPPLISLPRIFPDNLSHSDPDYARVPSGGHCACAVADRPCTVPTNQFRLLVRKRDAPWATSDGNDIQVEP